MALDLPTQCGYDSDDPEVSDEVGRVGVAVDTLADAEVLFDGIPLDRISTSFTINGTAAILLAFYVAAAERKGVPRAKLTGTIQNDILKGYASRGTGSGCSLGHPVAATGARMLVTLVHELRRRGGGIGVAAMCAGGGMGSATVIEVPAP